VKDEEVEKDVLQQMGMNIQMPSFDDSIELNDSHDADDSRVSIPSIPDDSIRSHSNVSMSEVEEEVVWLEEHPSTSSTNDDHPEPAHDDKSQETTDKKTVHEGQESVHITEDKLDGMRQEQSSSASKLPEPHTKSKDKIGSMKLPATKTLSPKKTELKKSRVKKGDSYQFVTPSDYTYFNIKDPKKNATARVGRKKQEESRNRRSALKGALRNIGIDSDDDDDEIQKFLADK
jgi:hypothetical protein